MNKNNGFSNKKIFFIFLLTSFSWSICQKMKVSQLIIKWSSHFTWQTKSVTLKKNHVAPLGALWQTTGRFIIPYRFAPILQYGKEPPPLSLFWFNTKVTLFYEDILLRLWLSHMIHKNKYLTRNVELRLIWWAEM